MGAMYTMTAWTLTNRFVSGTMDICYMDMIKSDAQRHRTVVQLAGFRRALTRMPGRPAIPCAARRWSPTTIAGWWTIQKAKYASA
jgi:hypothetical protein